MSSFKTPEDIKVGVIGYGGAFNMGRQHLTFMKKAGMTPVAVAELDETRLKVAREEFPGIETYTSVSGMLDKSDVNLVVIITPHNTHAELALQCLRAGRHVISEKPLAITTEECDAMIREATKRDLLLSTYHNRHWDGCILEALDQIHSRKVIGEVYRIEAHMGGYNRPGDWWRSSKSISGGILYDWGVHLLEYSLQILQSDIVEVTGFAHTGFWADETPWQADTNEDEATAVVRFKDGTWINLTMSSIASAPRKGWLEITGTEGTYIFDGGTYEILQIKDGEKVVSSGKNPNHQYDKYYDNIAAHLSTGEDLIITPEWSRRPIHILDLACKSAAMGQTLKAKYV